METKVIEARELEAGHIVVHRDDDGDTHTIANVVPFQSRRDGDWADTVRVRFEGESTVWFYELDEKVTVRSDTATDAEFRDL